MALFIAKRRKEFNEGPLLILSIDSSVRRGGSSIQWLVTPMCAKPACHRHHRHTLQSSSTLYFDEIDRFLGRPERGVIQ